MKAVIGQYVPGDSLLHKADPRTKLLCVIAFMVAVMLINTFIGYAVALAFVILAIIVSKIPVKMVLKSIRPLAFILIFTVILNVFFYRGETLLWEWWIFHIYREGIIFAIQMMFRIIILVTGASMLTFTTTSMALTDGMEKLLSPLKIIKFPAAEIAMMMSIALRFIPTFSEETDRLMKAQSSRGANFDTGHFMEKIRSFIPIIIPLIISAFRRAEDLAVAMESRCYRGGSGRTRYRVLKFTWRDIIVAGATAALMAVIIVFKI